MCSPKRSLNARPIGNVLTWEAGTLFYKTYAALAVVQESIVILKVTGFVFR